MALDGGMKRTLLAEKHCSEERERGVRGRGGERRGEGGDGEGTGTGTGTGTGRDGTMGRGGVRRKKDQPVVNLFK